MQEANTYNNNMVQKTQLSSTANKTQEGSDISNLSLTLSLSQVSDRQQSLCDSQHSLCDRQHSVCDSQHSLCDRQHSVCDRQLSLCDRQLSLPGCQLQEDLKKVDGEHNNGEDNKNDNNNNNNNPNNSILEEDRLGPNTKKRKYNNSSISDSKTYSSYNNDCLLNGAHFDSSNLFEDYIDSVIGNLFYGKFRTFDSIEQDHTGVSKDIFLKEFKSIIKAVEKKFSTIFQKMLQLKLKVIKLFRAYELGNYPQCLSLGRTLVRPTNLDISNNELMNGWEVALNMFENFRKRTTEVFILTQVDTLVKMRNEIRDWIGVTWKKDFLPHVDTLRKEQISRFELLMQSHFKNFFNEETTKIRIRMNMKSHKERLIIIETSTLKEKLLDNHNVINERKISSLESRLTVMEKKIKKFPVKKDKPKSNSNPPSKIPKNNKARNKNKKVKKKQEPKGILKKNSKTKRKAKSKNESKVSFPKVKVDKQPKHSKRSNPKNSSKRSKN